MLVHIYIYLYIEISFIYMCFYTHIFLCGCHSSIYILYNIHRFSKHELHTNSARQLEIYPISLPRNPRRPTNFHICMNTVETRGLPLATRNCYFYYSNEVSIHQPTVTWAQDSSCGNSLSFINDEERRFWLQSDVQMYLALDCKHRNEKFV